jgi:dimethylhistidine N-methyltransferase
MIGELGMIEAASTAGTFLEDVLHGLASNPKTLPSKYFYDKRGSLLFDRITTLAEYYPTRAETELLKTHAGALCNLIGPGAVLVELGSGSSVKTRIVLDRLERPERYVPMDISAQHLHDTAASLRAAYPELEVRPVVADYSRELPPLGSVTTSTSGRTVVFFPGSSIGNFEPDAAVSLLARVAPIAGREGLVVVGVDVPKERLTLERAYNDSRGVTELFNKNLLHRINHELGGDFDVTAFRHDAPWDANESRIEMHLVSAKAQTVHVGRHKFNFAAGESIVTEHCYKWSPDAFAALAHRAGLRSRVVYFDPGRRMSMHVLAPQSADDHTS